MEKRKLKFNILDIAILVAIICSVAVLIFRDVIHDAFGEPERLIFVFVFIALAIGCAYGMSKIVPLFLS